MKKLTKFVSVIVLFAVMLTASSIPAFAASFKSEPDVITYMTIDGYSFDIGIPDAYTSFNKDAFTYNIYDQSGNIVVGNLQGKAIRYGSSTEHDGASLSVRYYGEQVQNEQAIELKTFSKYTLVIEEGAFSTADNQTSPKITVTFKPFDLQMDYAASELKKFPKNFSDDISDNFKQVTEFFGMIPAFLIYMLIMLFV